MIRPIRVLLVDDEIGHESHLRQELIARFGVRELPSLGDSRPHGEIELMVISGQEQIGKEQRNSRESVIKAVKKGSDSQGTPWNLVLLDVQFEETDARGNRIPLPDYGVDLFHCLREQGLGQNVVLFTGKPQKEVAGFGQGAPYISKQDQCLDRSLQLALIEYGRLTSDQLNRLLGLDPKFVVGEKTRAVYGLAMRFAWDDQAGHSNAILITGETGTGKEHVARFIHDQTTRKGKFVARNAAAIPADLLESELFGTVPGAYSGATNRAGAFEEADQGTLFLDEIGDMPSVQQAKLLRVLDNQRFSRLGETRERHSDFRFVCATNSDLEQALNKGSFRGDLLARISQRVIHLPPLRERAGEAAQAAKHYLEQAVMRQNKKGIALTTEAEAYLATLTFEKANFREIQTLINRVVALKNTNQVITPADLMERPPSREGGKLVPAGEDSQWTRLSIPGRGQEAKEPGKEDANPPFTDRGRPPGDVTRAATLLQYIESLRIDMADRSIIGLAPRIEAATGPLVRRITGALLEKHRRADGTFNRQRTVQDLENDASISGALSSRRLNAILGKRQDNRLSDEQLEALVAEWRAHSSAPVGE